LVDYVDGIGVIDKKRSAPFFKTFSAVGRLSCNFDELNAHRKIVILRKKLVDHVDGIGVIDKKRSAPFFKTFSAVGKDSYDIN